MTLSSAHRHAVNVTLVSGPESGRDVGLRPADSVDFSGRGHDADGALGVERGDLTHRRDGNACAGLLHHALDGGALLDKWMV